MSEERKSQATRLVELAHGTAGLELFRNADGEAFVMLPAGTHQECWPLRGGQFRRWLAGMFYHEHGKAAGGQGVADALGVLEGEALFRGPEHEVYLRLAENDGAIYLDLCDDLWQAIRITNTGWEVVHSPPIRFRRPRGMRPLPYPERGGSLDELREFVNVSDAEWPLLAAWVVATLRPRGPYPVLQLHGEQGSAKSTTERVVRSVVDPNVAPLRSEPRDGRDLMIAAHNGWVVAYDNVSHLAPWLSDAVCRLSTGGGFATRELFTDTDEILIDVQRPVVMNGIEELAVRGDLLDRSIVLYLPRIDRYRAEDEFWTAFAEAQPRILGALLDAVTAALGNLADVQLQRPPRMADFALWAVAAEPALGLDPGAFLAAYAGNRADAHALALETSPISDPLRVIAAEGFRGTATELLLRLGGLVVDETVTKGRAWPKSASALSGSLRRLAPSLRAIGVEVEFDRTGPGRWIDVRTGTQNAVMPVIAVTNDSDDDGDDGDDGVSPPRSNGLAATPISVLDLIARASDSPRPPACPQAPDA
jgi:hypothetical protein